MLLNNSFVHSVISEFQDTIWFKEMRQRNTAVRSTFKIRHGDKKKQDIWNFWDTCLEILKK